MRLSHDEALAILHRYFGDYARMDPAGFDTERSSNFGVADYGAEPHEPRFHANMGPVATTGERDHRYSMLRRLTVVSDTAVIQEPIDDSHELIRLGGGAREGEYSDWRWAYSVACADPIALAEWLTAADSFIRAGRVRYRPCIVLQAANHYPARDNVVPSKYYLKQIGGRYLIHPRPPVIISDRRYEPLIQLKLPCIEQLELPRLFQLYTDYPEALTLFRNHVESALDELAATSSNLGSAIRRAERDLEDGAYRACQEYRRVKRIAAVGVTAAAIASWTLAIYAILADESGVLRILGPGGAATLLAKEVASYIDSLYRIRQNGFYFLAVASEAVGSH